jgi:hypothetical protein
VSENRVVRRTFGPKRNEVIGGLQKLHNEELLNRYSLPSIIRMIKSRGNRWAENVAKMEEKRKGHWWEILIVGECILLRTYHK